MPKTGLIRVFDEFQLIIGNFSGGGIARGMGQLVSRASSPLSRVAACFAPPVTTGSVGRLHLELEYGVCRFQFEMSPVTGGVLPLSGVALDLRFLVSDVPLLCTKPNGNLRVRIILLWNVP